ncbi:hypothetical protein BB560_002328 [Smittium megazygosporum]|uniref:Uncharacterized protein n=1 Tax=Smittium megazygosporum TaxID=133381 RepID=A0A2T9ZF55_9FUNG|nr:hypothetical protein BB560_002328 [Smittium megazygosporum]
MHPLDQSRLDVVRKLPQPPSLQSQPPSLASDQYFPPYYSSNNNNSQQSHHLSNRSNSGPGSNNPNLYHQPPPDFHPQLNPHNSINSYVNHPSYTLQNSSSNSNQNSQHLPPPSSATPAGVPVGPPSLINPNSAQSIGFNDIVANPLYDNNSPTTNTSNGNNAAPNGNYWSTNLNSHPINHQNQNSSIRQSYPNSLEKI